VEISREDLERGPDIAEGERSAKADQNPPGTSGNAARYLLLAGGALALVVGAALMITPSSEETVTDAPQIEQAVPIQNPQTEEIERHLESARDAMESDRLTSPPENNAYYYYQKVLDLEPGNESALRGLTEIAARYAESAEQQIAQGNLIAARMQAENGLSLQPGNDRLLALQQRISDLENAEIESYLLHAKAAFESDKLTTPAEDNAFFYYQKVLALRPGHEEALQGITTIAERYADLAEWSINEYKYSDAKIYVSKGLDVQPNHARLLALQERTDAVKDVPDRIFKGIKSVFD
jgi:serine/threonine-protein kinase PpkA